MKTVPLHCPPLSAYALNLHGRPALLVKTPAGFDLQIEATQGIGVYVDPPDADPRFLRLESETKGVTTMFVAVADFLLEQDPEHLTTQAAFELLVDRFDELRQMFARRGRLGDDAIRGLYAELLMLLELRTAGLTPEAAASAWHGPYRAAKDFILTNQRCIEVKSMRPLNHRVRISSIDQLDPRDYDLRLAVIPLEKCAPGDGRSLLNLMNEVESWMSESPFAATSFAQALAALGFDSTDTHYEQWSFESTDWSWFTVEDGFPRVHTQDVPSAVSHLSYVLDIDQLNDFKSEALWIAH